MFKKILRVLLAALGAAKDQGLIKEGQVPSFEKKK